MADIYYTGKAPYVAQQTTVQITGYDAATVYALEVNGVGVSVSGAGDATATAAALASAWNVSNHPYLTPVTASSVGDLITLLGDTPSNFPAGSGGGFPFIVEPSVSGGGGTIGAAVLVTAATGPHHYSDPLNWSTLTVPVTGDTVTIDVPGARLCWDIDRSALGETCPRFEILGDVRLGLQSQSVTTAADGTDVSPVAPEYRATYFKQSITDCKVLPDRNVVTPNGSALVKIHNTIGSLATMEVHQTAAAAVDVTRPAVMFLSDNPTVDLYVFSARAGVGVAVDLADEVASLGEIHLADLTSVSTLRVSDGVSFGRVEQAGGRLDLNSAAVMSLVKTTGGQMTIEGSQDISLLDVSGGGAVVCNTTGTVVEIRQDGGSIDFWATPQPRTVTNYFFNRGERRTLDGLTITNDLRTGRITETVRAG